MRFCHEDKQLGGVRRQGKSQAAISTSRLCIYFVHVCLEWMIGAISFKRPLLLEQFVFISLTQFDLGILHDGHKGCKIWYIKMDIFFKKNHEIRLR